MILLFTVLYAVFQYFKLEVQDNLNEQQKNHWKSKMIYPYKVRIQQIIKRNFLKRKTSKVIKMANLEYLMWAIS